MMQGHRAQKNTAHPVNSTLPLPTREFKISYKDADGPSLTI